MDTTFATPQPNSPPIWNDPIPARSIPQKVAVAEVRTTSILHAFPSARPSLWSVSFSKRILDFSVAALALLISWPLLLLTAIVVRLESPGPVIFRQKRVGKDGLLFTLLKFRTMDISAQRDGPFLTKRGDPRITRSGCFLRRYKLDELPQLINVLRGDMSLIGPRPKVPHLEAMEMPFRPGLTGAATLAFRGEEEMLQDIPDHELEAYYCRLIKPIKVKLDWEYMGQATLTSDLALLYETAACCISKRPCPSLVDLL